MKPKTLILRAAGTNCDGETAHAFEMAGATSERVHINRLLRKPGLLDQYQILAIPGGFSYGDDIAAGRILANQIRHHLGDVLRRFVDAGRPVIGVCNGFQVLIKTDLLPGRVAGRSGQSCTLTNNDCGRFIDRWVRLTPLPESKCIWTRGLRQGSGFGDQGSGGEGVASSSSSLSPEPRTLNPLTLPVAHGEGKFVAADDDVRRALWDEGQVALVYANEDGSPAAGHFPDNPNGSTDDIAGVCDPTGLVFGLMPHPERYVDPTQHPAWTRSREAGEPGQGLAIFRNAVEHVAATIGAGV